MFAHPVTESVLDGFTPVGSLKFPPASIDRSRQEKQSFVQDLRRPTAGGRIPNGAFQMIGVVPVERIELPTFGLQNRCSTAELNRRTMGAIVILESIDVHRSLADPATQNGNWREARAVEYQTCLPRATGTSAFREVWKGRAGCYTRSGNQARLGISMAAKLRMMIACVLSVLAAAASIPARAADPALCRQYARAAVVQARAGLASARCGARLQGARWSTEFSGHYEWCLEASREAVTAEQTARVKVLKGCGDRD